MDVRLADVTDASGALHRLPGTASRRDLVDHRAEHLVWRACAVALGAQLAAMVAFSAVQYHRFALSLDFAAYSQVWPAIAHGHLSPTSSVIATPFWRNRAEFVLWPLATLYWVAPSPFTLLVVQDLAVVAAEAVAVRWIAEAVRASHRTQHRMPAAVLLATAVFVVEPWGYQTAAFDFHTEPIAGLFALLAAWTLWRRRLGWLWLWVPLALLSDALGGLYLLGVGVSGLLALRQRRDRAAAMVVAAVGLAWLVAITAVGANGGAGGTGMADYYGYLVGPHHGRIGIADIVLGILRHPAAALHVLDSRLPMALVFLLPLGLVGVVSAWAAPMVLVTFVPAMVDANPEYFRVHQSFQVWPAVPFVVVGTAMLLARLPARPVGSIRLRRLLVAGWLGLDLATATVFVPDVPRYWLAVDAPAAAQLARVEAMVRPSTEVIASQGVAGRLAVTAVSYAYWRQHRFPVLRRTVLFVITPRQGVSEVPPAEARHAIAVVAHDLHARPVVERDGVFAFRWVPPPGVSIVTLP